MKTKLKLYQKSKKSGFTLLETIIAIGITCLTCMMIFSTLQIVWKINANETKNDRLQWEQFRSVIESSNLDFKYVRVDNENDELFYIAMRWMIFMNWIYISNKSGCEEKLMGICPCYTMFKR